MKCTFKSSHHQHTTATNRKPVATHPYDTFRQLMSGRRYREAAFFAARAANATGRDQAFWLHQQSVALLQNNRPAEALLAAERVLQLNPSAHSSIAVKADALLLSGDTEAALTAYREAHAYPAVADKALRGVLDCLIKIGRFDEALAVLSGSSEATEALYPYRVRILEGCGKTKEALAACNSWLAVSSDNRAAQWLLCMLGVKHEGNRQTLTKFEHLAKTAPRQSLYKELFNWLCRTYGDSGEPATVKEIPDQRSHSATIHKTAFALAKTGKERDAIPLFEEILHTAPTDEYVNNAYIAAARRVAYLDKAHLFYRDLLDIFPEEKSLYGRISKILRDLERNRESL